MPIPPEPSAVSMNALFRQSHEYRSPERTKGVENILTMTTMQAIFLCMKIPLDRRSFGFSALDLHSEAEQFHAASGTLCVNHAGKLVTGEDPAQATTSHGTRPYLNFCPSDSGLDCLVIARWHMSNFSSRMPASGSCVMCVHQSCRSCA